jgi:hypothetical protein
MVMAPFVLLIVQFCPSLFVCFEFFDICGVGPLPPFLIAGSFICCNNIQHASSE